METQTQTQELTNLFELALNKHTRDLAISLAEPRNITFFCRNSNQPKMVSIFVRMRIIQFDKTDRWIWQQPYSLYNDLIRFYGDDIDEYTERQNNPKNFRKELK